MDKQERNTLILFSGGQDSTTCLLMAVANVLSDPQASRKDLERLVCLNAYYGQRHAVEREQARKICGYLGIEILELDLQSLFAQSDSRMLSGREEPEYGKTERDFSPGVAATELPGRNAVLLTIGAAMARARGCRTVVLGVCSVDCSGYPDCRPEFVNYMDLALMVGVGIEVQAPLLHLTKSKIVRAAYATQDVLSPFYGNEDVVSTVLAMSHTCYRGHRPACGECASCVLRAKGFKEAGRTDPQEVLHA